MPQAIVVGAGLAGLSAAVELSLKDCKVDLFESTKKGGGRANSIPHYFHSGTSSGQADEFIIDNGQHILMGCYRDTLSFLKKIGAMDKISVQERMSVRYVSKGGKSYLLESGGLPYPLNLLQAILRYDYLTFRQKLKAIQFIQKLRFVSDNSLSNLAVSEWLKREGQTGELYKGIWEILCVGAMNSPPEKTSALIFAKVLREIFLKGKNNSKIIVPKCGLSELFVDNAIKLIEEKGGSVNFGNPLESIDTVVGRVVSLKFRDRTIENPENTVLAIPHFALKKIDGISGVFPEIENGEMEYSSITTFHLKLNNNPLNTEFVALINSPVQWVFNHGDYITTVTSASTDWNAKEEPEIIKIVLSELENCLGIKPSTVTAHKMIKEKRATFVCGGKNLDYRLPSQTGLENLYLAGDWTDTGLPATIEGAVMSGKTAANLIISKNQNA
ncbi:MAG: hydroxysqualene dehydroxylase HpnE [Bacteroidetes bacterium]|nr:hydroxysqualene dehydroxylase HpnE [Bacteroidota bacterium]